MSNKVTPFRDNASTDTAPRRAKGLKHSVMGQLLAVVAVLMLGFLCQMIYCQRLVKKMTVEGMEGIANSVTWSIAGLVEFIASEVPEAIGDLQHYRGFGEYLDRICKENNLFYIYVYSLDVENNMHTYYAIGKGVGAFEDIEERINLGEPVPHPVRQAELIVLNGAEDGTNTEMYKNEYGEVLTSYMAVYDKEDNIILLVGADVAVRQITDRQNKEFAKLLWVVLPVFALTLAAVYLILRKNIVDPARKMSRAMINYDPSAGERVIADVGGTSEFDEIAESFNKMTARISEYLDSIEQLTLEKYQNEREADAASEIQRVLLPSPVYSCGQTDINAFMLPAKDVGGDLYSYYDDGGKIYAVIADVSGKGMAAALMMVKAMTIMTECCEKGCKPSEILAKTNASVSANNPQMMFITAFAGVYEKNTGIFTYSNAGHNPPFIISGNTKKITSEPDIVLGLFDDTEYHDYSMKILPGEMIFMYTDGVTEAVDPEKQLFGENRLEQVLNGIGEKTDVNVTELVYGKINEFVDGHEQSDDITMLSITVKKDNSKKIHSETVLSAEVGNLKEIQKLIMNSNDIKRGVRMRLIHIAEEIFVNICSYAYEDTGDVLFELDITDGGAIMRFTDSGTPFNPLENTVNIDEYDMTAQTGGLGRFITVNIADNAEYKYSDNKNILTVTVKEEE